MAKRLFIETKEVAILLGRSLSTARRRMQLIRDAYNKPDKTPITIAEFCAYYDISPDKLKLL